MCQHVTVAVRACPVYCVLCCSAMHCTLPIISNVFHKIHKVNGMNVRGGRVGLLACRSPPLPSIVSTREAARAGVGT